MAQQTATDDAREAIQKFEIGDEVVVRIKSNGREAEINALMRGELPDMGGYLIEDRKHAAHYRLEEEDNEMRLIVHGGPSGGTDRGRIEDISRRA